MRRRVLRRRSEQVRRQAFFDGAASQTSHVAVDTKGLTFIVSTKDKSLSRGLFSSGNRPEFTVLPRACERIDCRGVFVDVGANIGTTSLSALRYFDRVIAVEPGPENAALLRANAALNGLEGRIEVHEAACSSQSGEVQIRVTPNKHGGHAVKSPKPGTTSLVVPAVTLDELIAGAGLAPTDVGLVWMDVEGYEAQALDGARSLLEARVPLVVEIRARIAAALLEVVGGRYSALVDLRDDLELSLDALPEYLAGLHAARGRGFTDILFLP